MDPTRFDALSRALGRAAPRRAALGLAVGAMLGAVGTDPRPSAAWHHAHQQCEHGRHPCQGACCATGKVCVGGACVSAQGNCPDGADACSAGGATPCATPASGQAACSCYRRLEGGVRCVQFTLALGACDQCKTDADCVALGFPRGSSCVRDDGPGCMCHANVRGYCGEPCGWVKVAATPRPRVAGPRR